MRPWLFCLALWMAMYAFVALTNVTFELQKVAFGVLAALVALFIFVDYRTAPKT